MAKQFVPVTNGFSQLDFSYEESGAIRKVDQLLQVWKQIVRMSIGNLNCKVTPKYMVWRAKKVKDVVIPAGMKDVQFEEELPEMPSELEIAKQIVDARFCPDYYVYCCFYLFQVGPRTFVVHFIIYFVSL